MLTVTTPGMLGSSLAAYHPVIALLTTSGLQCLGKRQLATGSWRQASISLPARRSAHPTTPSRPWSQLTPLQSLSLWQGCVTRTCTSKLRSSNTSALNSWSPSLRRAGSQTDRRCWIGATDSSVEGTWEWTSAEFSGSATGLVTPGSYPSSWWAPGEPDNDEPDVAEGEDCAIITGAGFP